jgi:hypothetical protein
MKRLLMVAAFALVVSAPAMAQGYTYGTGSNGRSTYVAPHSNSNGSFTEGHYRTAPDSSRSNNYGADGNSNPYTGRTGNGYGGSRRY